MSDHEHDFEHIEHRDANGRDVTPPRSKDAEDQDKTPSVDLNSLDETMMLSPDAQLPAASGTMTPHAGDDEPVFHETKTKKGKKHEKIHDKAELKPSTESVPVAAPRQPTVVTAAPSAPAYDAEPTLPAAFSFNVSQYYPYLNWEDPVKTGFLFLGGLAAFFVFGVLRIGIFSFIAHAFMFGVVGIGAAMALKAHNIHIADSLLQQLTSAERQWMQTVPKRVSNGIERIVNEGLKLAVDVASWQDPVRSLRVLALVWLAFHHIPTGKFALFMAFLAVFSFPYAATHHRAALDNMYNHKIKPLLISGGDLGAKMQQTTTLVNGLLVTVLGGVLWYVFFSASSWLSMASLAFVSAQYLPRIKPKIQQKTQ